MIETSQETIMRTMTDNGNDGVSDEQRFALHLIDSPTKLTFNRYAYSQYKYGDCSQAKQFGQETCTGFLAKYHDFLLSSPQEFVVISSPRGSVPPAAYYICQAFLEQLNRFFQVNGRQPVHEHTIQRIGTIAEDYSLLSRHERFERLVDERYFLDSEPLTNKFLIFVDDIRITGMHEMNIIRLLNTSHIYNARLFIYYAQLINEQIPSSFEHELNRCAIDDLEHLLPIIVNPLACFQINTRVLKEILRANLTELDHFLHAISTDLMSQLYHASLACNYQTMDKFAAGLRYLQFCLQERRDAAHDALQ